MTDRVVPETRVSVFGSAMEKWAFKILKSQVEQGFSSFFFQIFAIFDDIEISSNNDDGKIFEQNDKYSCSTLVFNPFLGL